MKDKKEALYKALENIKNEESLARILNFVNEEAAMYRTTENKTPWDSLPEWQKDEIAEGIKEADNGEGVSLKDFKEQLKAL